jgi:hypothetical protein
MMISEQQARLALEVLYMQQTAERRIDRSSGVSPEFFERILTTLETLPDTRPDRIAEARAHLVGPGPSARDVASKIVDRMISDAIR